MEAMNTTQKEELGMLTKQWPQNIVVGKTVRTNHSVMPPEQNVESSHECFWYSLFKFLQICVSLRIYIYIYAMPHLQFSLGRPCFYIDTESVQDDNIGLYWAILCGNVKDNRFDWITCVQNVKKVWSKAANLILHNSVCSVFLFWFLFFWHCPPYIKNQFYFLCFQKQQALLWLPFYLRVHLTFWQDWYSLSWSTHSLLSHS